MKITKATYVKSPYQFKIEDVKLREVGPNDALIMIKACAICGSDKNFCSSEAVDWMAIGHEIAGVVATVGSNVTHVKPGDRVVLESGSFCGVCELCRNGHSNLCNKAKNIFGEKSMGFAEAIVVDKQCIVPLADGVPFDEASLMEPMGVAMDLFYTTGIELNDDVLVMGVGPIGLMALRFARLAGARKIYAAEFSSNKKRIKVAKMYGADEIIYIDKMDLKDFKFARGGVEKVMITSPPKTIASTFDVTLFGGTVAFLGMGFGKVAKVTFDGNEFHVKRLSLKASYAAPGLYLPRCMDMMLEGLIDVKPLITHYTKLVDIESAFINVRDNSAEVIKSVMTNE